VSTAAAAVTSWPRVCMSTAAAATPSRPRARVLAPPPPAGPHARGVVLVPHRC
jgi:hypothetical protein